MQISTLHFRRNARRKLDDPQLQNALTRLKSKFVVKRLHALEDLPEFDAIRDQGAAIRDHVLAHLDHYLLQFEQAAQARGAIVHWANDAAEATRIIADIARQHEVKTAIKSKSMVSEECALNDALEAAGVKVVETDLGEYILQLAKEPPSHIIAPVVHKNKEEVADLFVQHHGTPRQTDIAGLCREARLTLRPHFLGADMGISGANFLVAETGSVLLVTNEGNGRWTTTHPRVHVALTGIEKVLPTLEDAATLLRLLTRSATGQPISNYVSLLGGTRQPGDSDGPEHFHIVLLDNGRSEMLNSELAPILRCIRCGACMNHCPVYQNIGGHPYGWVYPGPMGSVLTPAFVGLEHAGDLPNASTFCGECARVCPVKIPLPDLLRQLRRRQHQRRLQSRTERIALKLWRYVALRPRLYGWITAATTRWLAGRGTNGLIRRLPWFGRAWTAHRDLPAPSGSTFRDLLRQQRK